MPGLLGLLFTLASQGGSKTDSELVRGIQLGDSAAFRALFDRYHMALYRFLLSMGTPSEAAEDILQDVFLGVWAGRTRLDQTKSIKAYLYRSSRNRSANHFRGRARFLNVEPLEPVNLAPSPVDEAHLVMLRARLSEAISTLPERRRAVFELCFLSGLTYKEAAEVLDVTAKTVENQMGYALKSIRAKLAPFLNDVELHD